MPAPSQRNIAQWFRAYFEHEGLEVDRTSSALASRLKHASTSKQVDDALDFVNQTLNGHGVEAIRGDYHVDNYYYDIVALYVNMGDTYNSTILYETDNDRFLLTSWGDWVERNDRKYRIE